MTGADFVSLAARELALFAAVGFLLFAIDDLLVDLLYFTRRLWRHATVYRRHPRAFGTTFAAADRPGWMAVFIPAWDEGAVIGEMLRTTLDRYGTHDYRLFVGHYSNDPRTAQAVEAVGDPRIRSVAMPHPGPTTKADCLNHLYRALEEEERQCGRPAKAVVLHDAEDLVHPLELPIFDRLIERAGAVQLPVVPLPDPQSRWVAGHYCDEFAESHGKELVVREAMGASVPLAGVACAIRREELAAIAAAQDGQPFDADSMTEDYELGLKLGQRGSRPIFARVPAMPGDPALVASRGHFPSGLAAAVRQKARWIGGIALSGWDRTGWSGGAGEKWFRLRDRRGPLAALLLLAGYGALFLFAQLWLVERLGGPPMPPLGPVLATLLKINAAMLLWRMLMRALFTGFAHGPAESLRSIPRLAVANLIAILAGWRALRHYLSRRPQRWDKTAHVFPTMFDQGESRG